MTDFLVLSCLELQLVEVMTFFFLSVGSQRALKQLGFVFLSPRSCLWKCCFFTFAKLAPVCGFVGLLLLLGFRWWFFFPSQCS